MPAGLGQGRAIKFVIRLLLVWIVDTFSLWITAAILPGIALVSSGSSGPFVTAAAAALFIGLVNLLVRPLILLVALPLGFFVIFAVGFLVNAVALLITSALLPALTVDGLLAAVIGGIILSAVNTIITTLTIIDDDDSFYQGVVERLAGGRVQPSSTTERGLLMIELDGLSYWRMQGCHRQGIHADARREAGGGWLVLSASTAGCRRRRLPAKPASCSATITTYPPSVGMTRRRRSSTSRAGCAAAAGALLDRQRPDEWRLKHQQYVGWRR